MLVDCNLPGPGLVHWLGMPWPELTICDVLRDRKARLQDVLVETPITGLKLVAGARDYICGRDLEPQIYENLLAQIRSIQSDFVLVDLPAGLNELSLRMSVDADAMLTVVMPAPDSVEATYRLVMAAFVTRLMHHPRCTEQTKEVLETLASRPGKPPNVRDVLAELERIDLEMHAEARRLASSFHPLLIVNQLRVKSDEVIGEALVSAAARWQGLIPRYLGLVDWDDNVWLSLRRGQPFLVGFPQSRASRGLEQIVRRMLSLDFRDLFVEMKLPPPTEKQNLYELLEIYPGASEEEVRRALKRVRDYFGAGGLAVRGVCSDEDREEYQRLAEEAHATLVDKSKRRAYDRRIFPDGFPTGREKLVAVPHGMKERVSRPHDSLPRVELRDDQLVDGAFLGDIRKQRGVELIDISNRAKISVSYLQAIEEERFDDLPAPVYVRGFVTEFARYLKIDPNRAAVDFMAKYESHQKHRKG